MASDLEMLFLILAASHSRNTSQKKPWGTVRCKVESSSIVPQPGWKARCSIKFFSIVTWDRFSQGGLGVWFLTGGTHPFFYRGTITPVCWSIGTHPNCNLNLIHPLPLRSFQWLPQYLQLNWWTSQPLSPQPLLPHWKACQRDCGEVFLPMPGNVPTWGQQLPASTLNGVGGALLLPPEASDGLQEFLWGWPVVLTHSLPKLLPDLYFSSSPSCCWLGLPESISYHKKHPRQLCSIGCLKTLQPQPPNSCFNRSWSTRTECPQRHLGSGQSSPWGGSWRSFWQRVPPGVPNRPLTTHLALPGVSSSRHCQGIQHMTRWCSAPLFSWMPKTYGWRSDGTTTNLIIDLQPLISVNSTEVQHHNTTQVQVREDVPPSHTLTCNTVAAQVALKSSSKTMESPVGAPSSIPSIILFLH